MAFEPFKAGGDNEIFLGLLWKAIKIIVPLPSRTALELRCNGLCRTAMSNSESDILNIAKPTKDMYFLATLISKK